MVLALSDATLIASLGALLAGVGALLSGIAALKLARAKGRDEAWRVKGETRRDSA